jgi:hypothetical protein
MSEACSTYGGRREVYIGWWWRNRKEGNNLEYIGVYGSMILKRIFRK